jgi:hypothetical protein
VTEAGFRRPVSKGDILVSRFLEGSMEVSIKSGASITEWRSKTPRYRGISQIDGNTIGFAARHAPLLQLVAPRELEQIPERPALENQSAVHVRVRNLPMEAPFLPPRTRACCHSCNTPLRALRERGPLTDRSAT